MGDNTAGETMLDYYGEDDAGTSVMPISLHRVQTDLFVKDALRCFLTVGFSGNDSVPDGSSPLLSGRLLDDAALDTSYVRCGVDLLSASASIKRQESQLQNKSSSAASS